MEEVDIYTDGACSGNPGPGGWGAILRSGAHEKEIWGGEPATTNNRMELLAVIRALDEAAARHKVQWLWVRGHSGHPENERADELARRGVDAVRRGGAAVQG